LSSAASLSGASGRYASAIFDLAQSSGTLDAVASEFETLGGVLKDSPELSDVISSPAYSREQQGSVMEAVASKAGVSDLTAKFVGLMAQKGRIALLPDAMKGFASLLADHRGEETAEVISAKPLSDMQREALAKNLKSSFGKDVKIDASVDPSLLGGLIVKVGSKMVDASLKSKLERLELAMKAD
jgi:F-type H+-transporting ATPase subunit delta